jgi:tetratricopeptide (TPR) repeat protein
LGDYQQAIKYHEQALVIRREIGDRRGEGNDLNNLGAIYEFQEHYEQALDYYQQAKTVFASLKLDFMVAKVEENIADVRRKMG